MLFKFIGHMCDPKENHDKVWGVIFLDDRRTYPAKVLIFWGRRGHKLQTKMSVDNYELDKLIRVKENKGYKSVVKSELDEIYPGFQDDLEKTAMWALLMI